MCSGDRLVADFVAGGCQKPQVPELADNLTTTVEGTWVVWAYKMAREFGDHFLPLSGRGSYPADAEAHCLGGMRGPAPMRFLERETGGHTAPDPSCTCGFHALSAPLAGPRLGPRPPGQSIFGPHMGFRGSGVVCLTVVLSGRVLAFEWASGGLLFRAARQTVVRVQREPGTGMERKTALFTGRSSRRPPDDPEGRLARATAGPPSGTGPVHLTLPSGCVRVAVRDDAGWCQTCHPPEPALRVPAPALSRV
jgi:hypothetical protein